MIGETLDTNQLIDGIQGNLTVELRDADTEKVVEKVETKNFIAQSAVRYLKYMQRANFFKDQISVLNANADVDYAWPTPQDHLVLSSTTAATDSANEWYMFGKLIGYAGKYTYSGVDPLLGSPNATLSEATSTYTKWVYDWPTNAGNGTIGSIGWMSGVSSVRATASYGSRFYSSCSIQDTKSTGLTPYSSIARKSSTEYFLGDLSAPSITTADQNFASTGSFSVGAQFKASTSLTGITWDSGSNRLWVLGLNASNAPIICSYNAAGVLQSGPTTITNRSYLGLTFDGTALWSLTGTNSTFTVYKISTAGADVSNFSINLGTAPIPSYDETPYAIACDISTQTLYVTTWARSGSGYGGSTAIGDTLYTASAIRAYDTAGNEAMIPASLAAWRPTSASRVWLTAPQDNNNQVFAADIVMIDKNQFLAPVRTTIGGTSAIQRILLDGMGSRALLPSPITKTNAQTLRITYQMDYT